MNTYYRHTPAALNPAEPAPVLPAHYDLRTRLEAAEALRAHPASVDRWIKAGALPCVRLGTRVLVRSTVLTAFIAAHEGTAPTAETPAAVADPQAVMNYPEAARTLRVARSTLDRWSAAGEIPAFHVGRNLKVRAADVAAFIDRNSIPATTGPLAGRSL